MTLIVGLGNPGEAYEKNRHNIGFMVVDHLIEHLKASPITKSSFHGELFKSDKIYLLKPTTYMNLSGKSVLAVKQFYRIEKLIVIHDDIDLAFGALRFKSGGGNGGHNGLKSIDSLLGKDYLRVRMGIGKPEHKGMVADYVLDDFSKEESSKLGEWIKKAAEASLRLAADPLETVSSSYSQKAV